MDGPLICNACGKVYLDGDDDGLCDDPRCSGASLDNLLGFVSYRRTCLTHRGQEDNDIAIRIKDRIERVLHARRIGGGFFIDKTGIEREDFEKKISSTISACKGRVFLLILTPGALDPRGDPNQDWMRKEIELAVSNNLEIIPVMATKYRKDNSFEWPKDPSSALVKVMKKNVNLSFYGDLDEPQLIDATQRIAEEVIKSILEIKALNFQPTVNNATHPALKIRNSQNGKRAKAFYAAITAVAVVSAAVTGFWYLGSVDSPKGYLPPIASAFQSPPPDPTKSNLPDTPPLESKLLPEKNESATEISGVASSTGSQSDTSGLLSPQLSSDGIELNRSVIAATVSNESRTGEDPLGGVRGHVIDQYPSLAGKILDAYVREGKNAALAILNTIPDKTGFNDENPEGTRLYILGQEKIQEGNIREGISLLEQASKLSVNDSMIQTKYGLSLYELGEYEKSSRIIENLIQKKPFISESWIIYAATLKKMGNQQSSDAAVVCASIAAKDRDLAIDKIEELKVESVDLNVKFLAEKALRLLDAEHTLGRGNSEKK